MTNEERQDFKAKIIQTIDQIENDIVDLEELTKPIPPENAIGRVSRMDAINNKSVNEANLRRSRIKLSRLQQALNKVNDAGFGQCNYCKKPIQAARLMYLPESTSCVKCAR
jgi:DnaK suppressor protein